MRSGLQEEITSSNKLPSDLVDDTNQTNKFVTEEQKARWMRRTGRATDREMGVIIANSAYGVSTRSDGTLLAYPSLNYEDYQTKGPSFFIGKGTLENVLNGKNYQSAIDSENKLPSDLVDDTNQTNKFVTTQEKTAWNAKYYKPNGGIPKTDLSSEVQASLDKADTAIQESDLEASQAIQDEKITAIENQIPTGEVNDTSITLTDSADYKVKEFGIEGNTEQATRNGKNLFDEIYENISTNIIYRPIEVGSGTFTMSCNIPQNNNGASIFLLPGNVSSGVSTSSNGVYINHSITQTSINGYVTVAYRINDYNPSDYDVMLEEGSTATPYEEYGAMPSPDYPSPVNNITGDVEVKVQNKNLAWNGWAEDFVNRINDNIKAKIETKDNKSCLFFSASAGYQDYDIKYLFKTSWKKNTAYTIDFDVYTSSSDANMVIEYTDGILTRITGIQTGIWTHLNITSISSKTIKYIRPYYSSGNTYIDLDTFMVVEGTTAGEYIPHQEQNYPISLGDIELCKIGEYQDYIYKQNGNWYKYGAISKVVLDGSEDGWNWSDTTRYTVPIEKAAERNAICNYFAYASYTTYSNTPSPSFDINPNLIYIGFHDKNITSLNSFKTWLSTHNTTAYYPLATPVITQITDTTLINQLNALEQAYTYKGVTYIDTDVETKPYMKVIYRKDIGLILEKIENIEARVSLLE